MRGHCYQINLQEHFGGGEVYTQFLTRALRELGYAVSLLVSPKAEFWKDMDLAGARIVPVEAQALLAALPRERSWVLTHGALPRALRLAICPIHFLSGVAHMPLFGRDPKSFEYYDLVFAVSNYVLESLKASPFAEAYAEPLYGVAQLDAARADTAQPIFAESVYDWDQRKLRDRLLGYLQPLYQRCRAQRRYAKRDGITLGIVSRLTPIKQFPQLFDILAPVLAEFPHINLEIFGSGGYASVRDLKQALRPLAARARFWGQQRNVAAVYRQIDFLLTGLPEKEALGLNIIEAQACGTPVLAVKAPPFTETVVEGSTGFFYRDPRQDAGADFARLLRDIMAMPTFPDPRLAQEHLARFSFAAFRERLARALPEVETRVAS